MYIWGKVDEKEEVSEFEPIEHQKWEDIDNQSIIFTSFYKSNIVTITSRLTKMLSGEFITASGGYQTAEQINMGHAKPKSEDEIYQNTLQFINISMNVAEQNRNISSYRPEGLPK
jgi:hypothetical protein